MQERFLKLEPRKLAESARSVATSLERYGDDAIKRARDYETALNARSDSGGSPGGHSDPIGRAAEEHLWVDATGRVRGSILPASAMWAETLERQGKALADAIADMAQTLATIMATAPRSDANDPTKLRQSTVVVCGNIHGCPTGSEAEPGRLARCYSCWDYLKRHGLDRRHLYDRVSTDNPHYIPMRDDFTPPMADA